MKQYVKTFELFIAPNMSTPKEGLYTITIITDDNLPEGKSVEDLTIKEKNYLGNHFGPFDFQVAEDMKTDFLENGYEGEKVIHAFIAPESANMGVFEDFYSPEGEPQTFSLRDLRAAFESSRELILVGEDEVDRYPDFFTWYKEYKEDK